MTILDLVDPPIDLYRVACWLSGVSAECLHGVSSDWLRNLSEIGISLACAGWGGGGSSREALLGEQGVGRGLESPKLRSRGDTWPRRGLQAARITWRRRAHDCPRAWICSSAPRDGASQNCHRPTFVSRPLVGAANFFCHRSKCHPTLVDDRAALAANGRAGPWRLGRSLSAFFTGRLGLGATLVIAARARRRSHAR